MVLYLLRNQVIIISASIKMTLIQSSAIACAERSYSFHANQIKG